MLTVDMIGRVRCEHARGKSMRKITAELRLSRDTVAKYLKSGETEGRYRRSRQRYPQLGPHIAALERLLEENERRGKRDRLNRLQIFEALQRDGYVGGYDAVRRYARQWSASRSSAPAAFIPLTFLPGEAYQFDWAEEWVILDGVTTTVQVAHFRLSHSRRPYVRVYLRQAQEMVFDAHARAFAFLGRDLRARHLR